MRDPLLFVMYIIILNDNVVNKFAGDAKSADIYSRQ